MRYANRNSNINKTLEVSQIHNLNSHTALNQSVPTAINELERHEKPRILDRVANRLARMTSNNSPIHLQKSLELSNFHNNSTVLPVLRNNSPTMQQIPKTMGENYLSRKVNQTSKFNKTLHNGLHAKGFRTPVKRLMPHWDAQCLKDSNNFIKEQQADKIQKRERKHKFREFLENQIEQRRKMEKAQKEQSVNDFNNMMASIDKSDQMDKHKLDVKRKQMSEIQQSMLKQSEARKLNNKRNYRHQMKNELQTAIQDKKQ